MNDKKLTILGIVAIAMVILVGVQSGLLRKKAPAPAARGYLVQGLNTDSVADLTRIVNTPARGIGKITLLKIVEGKKSELKGKTAEKVLAFEMLIEEIKIAAETKGASETLKFIIKKL